MVGYLTIQKRLTLGRKNAPGQINIELASFSSNFFVFVFVCNFFPVPCLRPSLALFFITTCVAYQLHRVQWIFNRFRYQEG